MTTLTLGVILASSAVLLAIGVGAVAKGRAFPALAVGWWWYVGTRAPVVGIIQVGVQAYADRYAYVPLIGIFVALVWSAARLTEDRPVAGRRAAIVAGGRWGAT